MKKTTKQENMLNWLKNTGDLSTMDAIYEIGTTRPANIVNELRKEYIIRTRLEKHVNRYGDTVQYAVYHYEGEKPIAEKALRAKTRNDGAP